MICLMPELITLKTCSFESSGASMLLKEICLLMSLRMITYFLCNSKRIVDSFRSDFWKVNTMSPVRMNRPTFLMISFLFAMKMSFFTSRESFSSGGSNCTSHWWILPDLPRVKL